MKKSSGFSESYFLFTALYGVNRLDPVFTDLGIFLLLLFSVESVSPEGALVGVGLVVPPTIRVLERVQAWFAFLSLKMRSVCLLVCLATPPEFMVVFRFVEAITLDALKILDSARKSRMTPLPVILTLGYTWVHVSISNCGNILADVEAAID